jgi:serine/threonine-protein kinase
MFSSCRRLTRFISFATQHALSGSGEPLKEYIVGVEVFDRSAGYDPRIDPIVRVEARRLRSKLSSYYASAGREDPVLIEFPKGAYAPVFRTRTSPASAAMTVQPFELLTVNELDRSFAVGLTEEIVHGLTSVHQLRVMHSSVPPGQSATLLRGSVRCECRRIRVISQLIDTSSQAYLWSEAYDWSDRNLMSAQDSIAQAIVARVIATLGPPGSRPRL